MKDGRGDGETRRRGEKKDSQARAACTSPRHPVTPSPHPASPSPLKEGEDFYREGAFVVFTARYHLRRGYCCESGCRHCPYCVEAGADERDEEKSVEEAVE
jgi:Family of unknown function (DUF5522)